MCDTVDQFLSLALPMKGRMIWDFENKFAPVLRHFLACLDLMDSPSSQDSQLYDPIHHSCINSISRPLLSSTILSHAEAHPNVEILFERKVGKVDWEKRVLYQAAKGKHGGWTEEGSEKGWDLLVGGDGNWSVVRGEMMRAQPYVYLPLLSRLSPAEQHRFVRTTYTQKQIPHVWIELHLPPGPIDPATGEATFSISPEHLHIWPRHEFMLIALPNKVRFALSLAPTSPRLISLSPQDKSFTMT